jgi:hypothetical protein
VAATAAVLLAACGSAPAPESEPSGGAALREALTFFASFDDGFDAAFAKGDRRIYSAPSYRELDERSPGYWGDEIDIAHGEGLHGHALRFKTKNVKALFYTADQNVAYSPEGWSGTVSFWLSLDPAADLEPGFCDPIQITDSAYNDSAIWVDFTQENPRQFRLGAFGRLEDWNPQNLPPDENPAFEQRLVAVDNPPFGRGKWTHVAIVYRDLGTPQGEAALYLDGAAQGTSRGISEPFGLDPAAATIRLGVNYVGLFDELTVFDRPLDAEEIRTLHELEGGAAAMLD